MRCKGSKKSQHGTLETRYMEIHFPMGITDMGVKIRFDKIKKDVSYFWLLLSIVGLYGWLTIRVCLMSLIWLNQVALFIIFGAPLLASYSFLLFVIFHLCLYLCFLRKTFRLPSSWRKE